jgi:ABC-type transport system involved in multi-copper enzyme maturation permease subunit
MMESKFENNTEEFELEKIAGRKVLKLKSFYTHTFFYIVGVLFYIAKEYLGFGFNFFPLNYLNGLVMCIWSIAFFISVVDIFASFKIFGEEWEERKVKSILEKKNKKQKWE